MGPRQISCHGSSGGGLAGKPFVQVSLETKLSSIKMTQRSSHSKKSQLSIEKVSGEAEVFSEYKLGESLRQVGASPELVDRVVDCLRGEVYEGMPTSRLYQRAFQLLRKEKHALAARYSLKRAIQNLGPTGFPFERLIGALLESRGYRIKIDQTFKGKHVSHEVDVVAEIKGHKVFVECKYHNRPGNKSDVKVALYVHARSLDLQGLVMDPETDQFWLATNTKFTGDAIKYGTGVGLQLLAWDYPPKQGLKDLIPLSGLHPLTCLTTLKKELKRKLLDKKIVLCRELSNGHHLSSLGLNQPQIRKVLNEINELRVSV